MTDRIHAIIWLDHRDAKVFRFSPVGGGRLVLHAAGQGHHLQHKANTPGSGHHGVDAEYYGRIADSLQEFDAILLTGPGTARLELKNFIDAHRPAVASRIRAVEALDHPSDPQILDLGRRFFHLDEHDRAVAGRAHGA